MATARGGASSRLLRFWVKAPKTNSEIGTTRLARARARGVGRHEGEWQVELAAGTLGHARVKDVLPHRRALLGLIRVRFALGLDVDRRAVVGGADTAR